jgi:hypothetical protein
MTPKEKAEELVNKMIVVGLQMRNEGIKCALIAVDEVLNTIMSVYQPETKLFWLEVKQEIESL